MWKFLFLLLLGFVLSVAGFALEDRSHPHLMAYAFMAAGMCLYEIMGMAREWYDKSM